MRKYEERSRDRKEAIIHIERKKKDKKLWK